MGDDDSQFRGPGVEGGPKEADFDNPRFKLAGELDSSDFPSEILALAETLETGFVDRGEQEKLRKKILPYLPAPVQANASTLPRAIKFLIEQKQANQERIGGLERKLGTIKDRFDELFNPLIKQMEIDTSLFFGSFRRNYHIQAEADMYLRANVRRFRDKMEKLTVKGKGSEKIPAFTKDSYNISYDLSKGEVVCTFKNPVPAVYASMILHQLEMDQVDLASQRADKLTAVLEEKGFKETQIYELQEGIRARLEPLKMETKKDDDVARRLLINQPEGLIAMYIERGREIVQLNKEAESARAEIGEASKEQILVMGQLQESLDGIASLLMGGGIRFSIITGDATAASEVEGKYELSKSTLCGIESAVDELLKNKNETEAELAEAVAQIEADREKNSAELMRAQKWFETEVAKLREYASGIETEIRNLTDEKSLLEKVLRENNDYFGAVVDENQGLRGINAKLAEQLSEITGKKANGYRLAAGEEPDEIKAVRESLKGEIGKLKSALKQYVGLLAKQKGVEAREMESESSYLRMFPDETDGMIYTGAKAPESLESVIAEHKIILADFAGTIHEIQTEIVRLTDKYGDLIENLPEGYRLEKGESAFALREKFFAYLRDVKSTDTAYRKALLDFNKKYRHVLKHNLEKFRTEGDQGLRLARLEQEPAKSDKELFADIENYFALNKIFELVSQGSEEDGLLGLESIVRVEQDIQEIEKEYGHTYSKHALLTDLVDLIGQEKVNKKELKEFPDSKKYKFSTLASVKSRLKYLAENPDNKDKREELYVSPETADPQADYAALEALTSQKEEIKNAKPNLLKLVQELNSSIKTKPKALAYARKALEKVAYANEHESQLEEHKKKIVEYAKKEFHFNGDYELLKSIVHTAFEEISGMEELAQQNSNLSSGQRAFYEKNGRLAAQLIKERDYFSHLKERAGYLVELFGNVTGQELDSIDDIKALVGSANKQIAAYMGHVNGTEAKIAKIRRRRDEQIRTAQEKGAGKRVDLAQKMIDNLYKR